MIRKKVLGPSEFRTHVLPISSRSLYQLSYTGRHLPMNSRSSSDVPYYLYIPTIEAKQLFCLLLHWSKEEAYTVFWNIDYSEYKVLHGLYPSPKKHLIKNQKCLFFFKLYFCKGIFLWIFLFAPFVMNLNYAPL